MMIKISRKHIYIFSALLVSLFNAVEPAKAFDQQTADSVQAPEGFKLRTVVIDAGHGGKDPGAFGPNTNEKTVTLALALKLQKAIKRDLPDVNAIMTRDDDTFVELHKRADMANNAKGQLFISLHCNSLANRKVTDVVGYRKRKGKKIPIYKTTTVANRTGKGAMILVYGSKRVGAQEEALRENAVIFTEKNYKDNYAGYDPDNPASVIMLNTFRDKYRKQSIRFASLVDSELTGTYNRESHGVKEQVVLVLDHTAMPSILVETGFINNPDEEDYLTSDEGQTEIVNAILSALKSYKKQLEN
jgi:N-acetylmuramoyl-L-alanine amidase